MKYKKYLNIHNIETKYLQKAVFILYTTYQSVFLERNYNVLFQISLEWSYLQKVIIKRQTVNCGM